MDLEESLPETLRESFYDRAKDSPKAKEEAKCRLHTISSPLEWAIAFSNFMVVAMHFDPKWAFSLAVYQGQYCPFPGQGCPG